MRNSVSALLFSLMTQIFFTSVASADDVGALGTLVALQVNTASADTYLQYHGRAYVNSEGGLTEYRWGGTSCGTRLLTDEQVATLQRALHQKQMTIQPLFQLGQGDTKCVVGFTLVPKKSLKLGLPVP